MTGGPGPATDVLAVADAGDGAAVAGVASAIAEVLHANVRHLRLADGLGDDQGVKAVLAAMAEPPTLLCVLARDGASIWPGVIRSASKPVILVPTVPGPSRQVISRVLVPLDGTPEAARAVAETVDLFARSGVDVVVLHTFHAETAPRFWDQAAHARQSWQEEFLARHCALPGARLELRTGTPGEQVVDVSAAEGVDLITLGWSQDLDAGRARTVRRTLRDAAVPVMLVPTRPAEHP